MNLSTLTNTIRQYDNFQITHGRNVNQLPGTSKLAYQNVVAQINRDIAMFYPQCFPVPYEAEPDSMDQADEGNKSDNTSSTSSTPKREPMPTPPPFSAYFVVKPNGETERYK